MIYTLDGKTHAVAHDDKCRICEDRWLTVTMGEVYTVPPGSVFWLTFEELNPGEIVTIAHDRIGNTRFFMPMNKGDEFDFQKLVEVPLKVMSD